MHKWWSFYPILQKLFTFNLKSLHTCILTNFTFPYVKGVDNQTFLIVLLLTCFSNSFKLISVNFNLFVENTSLVSSNQFYFSITDKKKHWQSKLWKESKKRFGQQFHHNQQQRPTIDLSTQSIEQKTDLDMCWWKFRSWIETDSNIWQNWTF